MLQFLADENFNNQIVRGVFRRNPDVNIVRAQDVGLSEADDPTTLEWAAQRGRVVLTHDVATMTNFAYERVRAGVCYSGVPRGWGRIRGGFLGRYHRHGR